MPTNWRKVWLQTHSSGGPRVQVALDHGSLHLASEELTAFTSWVKLGLPVRFVEIIQLRVAV